MWQQNDPHSPETEIPNSFDFDSFSLWSIWGMPGARIAGGYRLHSQSIFSLLCRLLFTGLQMSMALRNMVSEEVAVNRCASSYIRQLKRGEFENDS
jgi:hypothetical protein